ncbi:MAG: O-antigen ligase family protein [Fimbriiglobus sp.]|jgi:O-antigen ligase|nr:O-antigen ligase family protein [Fimbriiglobus sp.]
MHFLLVGYMFLFIDRPFEVWPWLGDLRFERVYMLVTMGVWLLYPGKKWLPNPQHWAYAAFAAAVLGAWGMSRWMDQTQPKVEDWFKIVVFYILLVTTVNDEKGLKRMVVGFLGVMALYLLHSFREYLGGKFTYRMGISRMVGVDTTLGDPNSFGASIIFALPIVVAIWKSGLGGKLAKWLLAGYVGLSALCILLTGSRGSLIGLCVWGFIVMMSHRKRWLWLALCAMAAPVAFVALPAELQNRFETIINPDVGPENAKVSGEGRWHGFVMGMELWAANPLAGVGPGAWRQATGQEIESHNLMGQLAGELGTAGVVTFLGILGCFAWNYFGCRKVLKEHPPGERDLTAYVPGAVAMAVFLLLFMGLFGHNLFRFTWLWFGGFLIIARYCLLERVREAEENPPAVAEEEEFEEAPADDAALPVGWTWHTGHR